MKRIKRTALLFIFFITFSFSVEAQFVKNAGGTRADFGQDIAVDAAGNVYVTGNFAGTADFDPGPGVFNLQSGCPCDASEPPNSDIFLAKYDPAGNFLWAIRIGAGDIDAGQAVSLDASGNAYLTGTFRGTADFDPGAAVHNLTSAGNTDVFLAKYDTNGNYIWANRFGSGGADVGHDLKVDGSGNVLLIGSFFGTVDFDPGAGANTFNAGNSTDAFFAKYNAAGDLVWARDIEGTGEESGNSITTDGNDNIYITGTFFGTSDFDPGAGTTFFTGAGSKDPYFAKFDADGIIIWARTIGTRADEEAVSIAADSAGNLYATGYFILTTDFDPGAGTFNLISAGNGGFDCFVLKLNTAGDFQWAFKIGSTDSEIGLSVCVDGSGNPYISGAFQGMVDFNPGAAIFNLAAGGNDGFFAKYTATGSFVFAQKEGGTAEESLASITVDASNHIFATGYFTGTTAFETGASAATTLTSAGNADILFLKFEAPVALPVSFISFTGSLLNGHAVLQWTTTELNSYGFDIEKAALTQQADQWRKTGFVKSVLSGDGINHYGFTDAEPLAGKTAYRLKQIDVDGKVSYSPVVILNLPQSKDYALLQNSPNPARGVTTIRYILPERASIQLALYNSAGQKIKQLEHAEKAAGQYELAIDVSHLKAGVYYYTLQTGAVMLTRKLTIVP